MQPLPLSLEEWNHIQSSLEKWNDTENPSYLLHLHFTAEPLRAKWDVPRILRWFLNRMLVWSSTVSADGRLLSRCQLLQTGRTQPEYSSLFNLDHSVTALCALLEWQGYLIAMTALQNSPCVGFFEVRRSCNMIDLITQKGVPHQNKSCKEFHCRGALECEKGPSVWLRLIKCGSRACLFCLLRKPGRGWWIKHLGHVVFFIRVCIWYTLPFKWNYSHQDELGHDDGGRSHGEEGESKKSRQDLTPV